MLQASESDSVDELQSQLLEWQEIVTEPEDAHNQIREEKSAMALRMSQIEEEREGDFDLTLGHFVRLENIETKLTVSSKIYICLLWITVVVRIMQLDI